MKSKERVLVSCGLTALAGGRGGGKTDRNFLLWGSSEKGLRWEKRSPQTPTGIGIPHVQVFPPA